MRLQKFCQRAFGHLGQAAPAKVQTSDKVCNNLAPQIAMVKMCTKKASNVPVCIFGLGDCSSVAWSETGASFLIQRRSSCRCPSIKVSRNPTAVVNWISTVKEVFVDKEVFEEQERKRNWPILFLKGKVLKAKGQKWGLGSKPQWIVAPAGVLLRATTAAGLKNETKTKTFVIWKWVF